jgi:hypothetical protein
VVTIPTRRRPLGSIATLAWVPAWYVKISTCLLSFPPLPSLGVTHHPPSHSVLRRPLLSTSSIPKYEMIPGYDCPHNAVYLPSIIHGPVGSMKNPRAICVFERDMERPLNRHRGGKPGETGAVKDYALVIRSITTVGK